MPAEALVDPAWFRAGRLAAQVAVEDTYFADPHPVETPAATLMDGLLDGLPEPMRSAVRLRVVAFHSYGEIALALDLFCGTPPYANKKQAWRLVRRGLDRMRDRILTDPELFSLIPEEA